MVNKVENIITVINYIENNLTEKLNLSSIAMGVGYSKYHLHRMFVETVGLSIHDYVQRRQLTESAKLLVFSDKSILEISLIAGYESQQAFTNIFKQMYKKTPNEYRMNEEFYPLQLRFDLIQTVKQKLSQQEMEENIRFATTTDIPACLELAYLVIDGFPNLNENEYLTELERGILEQRVLILTDNTIAIALMSINYHTGSIDFFGVHPLYRKCGIAKLFLDKVMNELLVDPLEAIWKDIGNTDQLDKNQLEYTIMIRQPDFITKDMFFNALERVKIKKPNELYKQILFDTMQDAKSIEILHIGTYDDEPISFQKMDLLAKENDLVRSTNYHREIYLNNANRVLKSKLKTILRYCVK